MLEYQLLLLFVACAAMVFISGFVIVKFYRGTERQPDPVVIVIPLAPETENLEFIVRSCVYPTAESCSGAFVLAIDLGAGTETIYVFEKLMKRSCPYKIIGVEELSESVFAMRGKSL